MLMQRSHFEICFLIVQVLIEQTLLWSQVIESREPIQVAAMAKPTAKLGEKFQYQNVMYAAADELLLERKIQPGTNSSPHGYSIHWA
jgi:hypothetical protein